MARAAAHLKPGGALIVLSPAHPFLYTPFDAAIGHYRQSRSVARPSAGGGQVVAFTSVSVDIPAAETADVVKAIAAAGVDCLAISDAEEDGDLERFVTFLAQEVKPLVG